MLLYRPIKPFVITQYYAENKACVSDDRSHIITCDGTNPPKGYTSLYGLEGHKGLDLRAYHGQPIYCAQRGRVYKIDTSERSGLDVRIESTEDGRTFRHIYEHLLDYNKKVGDWVETGELIGHADNTGYSSGDHLHFEVLEKINDHWIHVDPLVIMDKRFAKDILAINKTIKYIRQQLSILIEAMAKRIR